MNRPQPSVQKLQKKWPSMALPESPSIHQPSKPPTDAERGTMTENPDVIRLNIQHYQDLLKLYCPERTRQQLQKMLADAQARLVIAEAKDRMLQIPG